MHRKAASLLASFCLVVVMTGCQKPYFHVTETDYVYFNEVSGDYGSTETDDTTNLPEIEPRTVREPARKIKWNLTLNETKRLALEYNKSIAVVRWQPAISGTDIQTQLSAFDTFYEVGAGWSRLDQQATSAIQSGQTGLDNAFTIDGFGGGASQNPFGVNATTGAESAFINPTTRPQFSTIPGSDMIRVSKRNTAGGLSTVGYGADYQFQLPNTAFQTINPFWRSRFTVALEQPVLQGAGVEFNRAPILIARASYEQQIRNFDRDVRTLLRDVEISYWQLYFTYQDLYSREVGMKQALATWQKEKNKQEVGVGAIPDVAQAREQYEFFRASRLQALSRVLSQERDLRRLLGLPPDDDRQIIPADEPTIAEYDPDWKLGIMESLEMRPELQAQRFAIRATELEVFRQKNGLLPDLTLAANWSITGLDDDWSHSVETLFRNRYADWYMGFRWRRQIGERSAHAAVRRAQTQLSQARAQLRSLEHDVFIELHEAYQNIVTNYELIKAQKDRREAATQQLEAREEFYRQGKTTIDVLLQAQNAFADALRDESQAVVAYNQSLISWEFSKGTILDNDAVVVAEEQITQVCDKYLKQRDWSWNHAIKKRLKPGKQVQSNWFPCPDCDGPLYPSSLWTNPDITEEESINPLLEQENRNLDVDPAKELNRSNAGPSLRPESGQIGEPPAELPFSPPGSGTELPSTGTPPIR
ncbi:outer membrane channel protein [Planctomycetes bacterium Pan216]|uniref:Outer membrane channel protein n=1 Tax=Kolteria novifilia TaxID=2527975 RepID=A0A518AYJ4_9BACT|nr:outer membrane channel protein [Planctomycetes bacterium Pan216]